MAETPLSDGRATIRAVSSVEFHERDDKTTNARFNSTPEI
jgi:hypothetical protein